VDFEKGSDARTRIFILQSSTHHALIHIQPRTGRFHQIRCHLAYLGFPIIGDPIYKGTMGVGRLFLHSSHIEFTWPPNKKKYHFSAPLPTEFQNYVE